MPSTRFVRITGSVGKDGNNAVPDVMAIQHLINVYPPHSLLPLAVDGRCGPRTIAAIEAVERCHLLIATPDGRIDPGGPTLRALNMARKMGGARGDRAAMPSPRPARAPAAPSVTGTAPRPAPPAGTSHRHRIPPREVIIAAQKSQQNWGVRASISIAQWILESGWGSSMPRGSNNPFGIKAASGQPFVMARTREEIHGNSVYIMAPFRAFASIEEAFDEHGRLLATHPAYALARAHLTDPDAYANALTGHYATDHLYGAKLIAFMRDDELYQYNSIGTVNDFGDPRTAAMIPGAPGMNGWSNVA